MSTLKSSLASHFASERLTADMRRDGGTATAASESRLTAHSSNAIQSRKKAPGCCKVRWSSSPDSRSRRSTTHSRSQLRSTTVRNRNRPDSHSRHSTTRGRNQRHLRRLRKLRSWLRGDMPSGGRPLRSKPFVVDLCGHQHCRPTATRSFATIECEGNRSQ